MTESSARSGQVVRTYKDGLPILWTYTPELLSDKARLSLPWLTVLSWRYDGFLNNRMPDGTTNESMWALDEVLKTIEHPSSCLEAYRRVGYGLREFILYVANQQRFLGELNERLANHPKYPIEIMFYNDETWSDFQRLIADFNPI